MRVFNLAIADVQMILTVSAAMKRMAVSNVLIVGMQGLGVEIGRVFHTFFQFMSPYSSIAKDVVLAGVKSVTIFDPEPVTIQDLSSQVRSLNTYLLQSFNL